MTGKEAFEHITKGGSTDFQRVIAICESIGEYCLVGGLAINCYVEPVYTLDADLVVATSQLSTLRTRLETEGFTIKDFPNSLNAQMPGSELRIQFTTDPRYQSFAARAQSKTLFGVAVRVASLNDLVQGKIWAWEDPTRRLSKRQKDQADLVRIAESFPEFLPHLPESLRKLFPQ